MTREWRVTSSSINLPAAFDDAEIQTLISMYSFHFGLPHDGLNPILGCYSHHMVTNFYHEVEYYGFPARDAPRRLGQLDRSVKAKKKAIRAARMALRVRLFGTPGRRDKAGNPVEEGEVRFYNPLTKEIQKQSLQEALRWLGDFLRPLREDWRQKVLDSGGKLDDIWNSVTKTTKAEIAFIEHMRRVWYLLHVTEAPLNTIHEVAWREQDMVKCKAMLDEIKGEDLASFNFHHLQALYS